jgi:hypothetical protein
MWDLQAAMCVLVRDKHIFQAPRPQVRQSYTQPVPIGVQSSCFHRHLLVIGHSLMDNFSLELKITVMVILILRAQSDNMNL